MHESAQTGHTNPAGLYERPAGPERFWSCHQAGKPRQRFSWLAMAAVIVTSGYALCALQTGLSATFTPPQLAALQSCITGCAQLPGPTAGLFPDQSIRPASNPAGAGLWQGQRIALQSLQDRHHVQEQENSCVPAAVKNLIHALTGKDIPEAVIRKQLAAVVNDGDYDFRRYGIDPVHALPVLEHFGVPSEARAGIGPEELARLTKGGRPLLIGISKPYLHRLMLDRVSIEATGEMQFHVRNSKTPSGLPGVLTRQEFEDAYNPSAIVIVPL